MPPHKIGERRPGQSGREKFRQLRWQALKRTWRDWLIVAVIVIASLVAVIFLDGLLRVAGGFMLGVGLMTAAFGWIIGGDVWSLPPAWGAVGEEQTGDMLETLDDNWWVEHDIPHEYGNYDHILIGPPGVFLLDSKRLSRTAAVRNDELRAGGMRYSGTGFRRAAVTLAEALGSTLGARPWVQSVVVVWGKLEHETREEDRVVYVQGENLIAWLQSQPMRASRERCEALARAVRTARGRRRFGALAQLAPRRQFQTRTRSADAITFLREARRRPVLHLHPHPLTASVRVALALRHHALEPALADDVVERLSVLERRHQFHRRPFQVKLLEQLASLRVEQLCGRERFDGEHVEDEKGDRDAGFAVQHPRAEPMEVRQPRLVERDDLVVELDGLRQRRRDFRQQWSHVPASSAAGAEPAVRADEAAVAVQFGLEQPAAAPGDRAGAGEHRFRQPQHRGCDSTASPSYELVGESSRQPGLIRRLQIRRHPAARSQRDGL
jgi:hypothetical protein